MSTALKLTEQTDWRQSWNLRVAKIFECLESGGFCNEIVSGLQELVDFQHAVTFGYPRGRRPVFLHEAFSEEHRTGAVTAYLRGTYLLDPFYEACCNEIMPGLYRMEQLAPDEFYEAVGAHPGYVSPCVSSEPGTLSEEIGYFARTADRSYVVLSLMRDAGKPPFSESEMEILREIAPFVCLALKSYFETSASSSLASSPDSLENAFDSFGVGLITEREQEVARLVLRGHSTESISNILEIAVSTVKIHRRNIYAKLEVASQAELFNRFLDFLLKGGNALSAS